VPLLRLLLDHLWSALYVRLECLRDIRFWHDVGRVRVVLVVLRYLCGLEIFVVDVVDTI
jgi:hypothetical protein